MRMQQLAWLLIGILLVARCQQESEHHEDEEHEDEHHEDEEHDEEGHGHRHNPEDQLREDEEKPIPWVPLGTGPPNDEVEPVEEDLSSDQVHRIFSKIDDDLDGKLSMDELLEFGQRTRRQIAEKHAKVLLQDVDEDSDEKATVEELGSIKRWLVENGYANHKDGERDDKNVDARKFKAADRDGNGGLDRFELPAILNPQLDEDVLHAHTEAKLKSLDRDGDGQLTEDEFYWGAEGRYQDDEVMLKMASDYDKLDRNHNGQINVGEMQLWESGVFHAEEAMKHLFEVGDKNKDRKITLEEFDRARKKIWSTPTSRHIVEWCDHYEL